MVDGSYASGRAGRIPGNARYPLQANPDSHLLQVGSVVKPNFASPIAQKGHPPGVILDITNGIATVRWKDWEPEKYCIHCLVKV